MVYPAISKSLFCLPQIGNEKYYDLMLSRIKEKNIEDDVRIIREQISNAFQVWELSDIFIRPTSTDMEGISVKEALDFHTVVIASDVCIRPKDTIIFRNRDFDDLYFKTRNVCYSTTKIHKNDTDKSGEFNILPKIFKIYESLK